MVIMKHSLNRTCLLALSLLLGIFIVGDVKATPTEYNNIDLTSTVLHKSRLHTLHLWEVNGIGWTLVVDGWKLKFSDWLVVWQNHSVGNFVNVLIGWWTENTVSGGNYAWIGWWQRNVVQKVYWVIGWWNNNKVFWQAGVVVWWANNTAYDSSVVVWWANNTASGWVVMWWEHNVAWKNSMVLWHNAEWNVWWFIFNWGKNNKSSDENAAVIYADSWILVGTTTPINWVNLVVKWAVKMMNWDNKSDAWGAWEIRVVSWCFYAFDGKWWHVLNRWADNSSCKDIPVASWCEFWTTIVQNWDTVKAYSKAYGTGDNCETQYMTVNTCNNWSFSKPDYIYPYCYSIHD